MLFSIEIVVSGCLTRLLLFNAPSWFLVWFKVQMRSNRPVVEVVRLGLVSYLEALRLQQVYMKRHGSGPAHALLLCQHPPVYTTGIRQKPYPAATLDQLRLLGAEVHQTNRGGLITFHGPGQLVCYPILNLTHFKKVCVGSEIVQRWWTETCSPPRRASAGMFVSWRRPSSPFVKGSGSPPPPLIILAFGSEKTRSAPSVPRQHHDEF